MSFDLLLAGGGAVVGAALGLIGLLAPATAARIVRLRADRDRPGGFAEFRATFGGLLLLAHLAVLLALVMRGQAGLGSVVGSSFAVGAGWLGAALGRALAMAVDHARQRTRTAYNAGSMVFEVALGLALLAPFLAHLRG